ncbi:MULTISPECIES: LysR substrate-binding domain-containing protein [unclassified Sinorhizobium]|uniref:LysR substrate-binding domain-containing protein n=1 Tax=unclassified Sinorhizobium TaxID=2613772 RepID=UPI0035255BB1
MKRGRLPLTALRSLEAAGRLESFTLAAEELFVSQAAISRQIRDLEQQLGKALFARHHRRVRLTETGAQLLQALTQSFDRIDTVLTEISREEAALLVSVSAEPSFAGGWLVPHLSEFRSLYPDIDVAVDSNARLIEFRSQEAELAIRHSATRTSWPRTEARHLVDTKMVTVISPELLAKGSAFHRPEDLLQYVLLHEENRSLWNRWFTAAGVSGGGFDRGPIFADGSLVLQAALRGHGVAMVDALLAEQDIRNGRLIQPFETAIQHGAYWLVSRDFRHLSEPAGKFARWVEGCLVKSDRDRG